MFIFDVKDISYPTHSDHNKSRDKVVLYIHPKHLPLYKMFIIVVQLHCLPTLLLASFFIVNIDVVKFSIIMCAFLLMYKCFYIWLCFRIISWFSLVVFLCKLQKVRMIVNGQRVLSENDTNGFSEWKARRIRRQEK